MISEKACLVISGVFLYIGISFSQTPANDPHWINTWGNDFRYLTKTGPDSNGNYIIGDCAISNNDGTSQAHVYLQQQVTSNSTDGLVITEKKQDPPYYCASCPNNKYYYYVSGNITRWHDVPSTSILQYGYIEAYIKYQRDAYGIWPAFWLQAQSTNPQYGYTCPVAPATPSYDSDEVDIFELTPGNKELCPSAGYLNIPQDKNIIRTNIHTCDDSLDHREDCGQPECRGQNLWVNDYTQWHKYAVRWSPSKIIYYVDDAVVRNAPNPGYPANPYGNISQPLNIFLGMGMNPNVDWPNTFNPGICPACTTYFDNTTYIPHDINTTPLNMYVQWVKYWKPNLNGASCATLVNQTVTGGNVNTFNTKMDRSYTTSGTISLSSAINWQASEFITINGDFDSNGMEVYLDVNPCMQ